MLTKVEQQNLFKALYMSQVIEYGDGTVLINYIDGTQEKRPISDLSIVEREKVIMMWTEQTYYSYDFGAIYQEKAKLGDGRIINVTSENKADFKDSLSGEKYRRILLANFQATVNFEEPRADLDFSWLRTNYINYLASKAEIIEFWAKVHKKKYEPVGFGDFNIRQDPYPSEDYFNQKLWARLPLQYKNEVIAEDNRRAALKSGDSGFFSPIANNLQGFFNNATNFVERNNEEIALAAAVVLTGGVAAAGGFGATAAATTNSFIAGVQAAIPAAPSLPSLTIPTATEIGKYAAAAALTQGEQIIKDLAAPKKENTVEPVLKETSPTITPTNKESKENKLIVFGSLAFLVFALGV